MLDEHVALLSCMQVNNETGAIQPIEEIARLLKQANPQALMHVDGVQGFLRVPFRMERSLVDLYSVSAHKIHGPKGVAALFVREGVRIAARVEGGGQEHALRSGTENTPGIAGFAAAAQWMLSFPERAQALRAVKMRLYERLRGAGSAARQWAGSWRRKRCAAYPQPVPRRARRGVAACAGAGRRLRGHGVCVLVKEAGDERGVSGDGRTKKRSGNGGAL